jgi:hypothetical protein
MYNIILAPHCDDELIGCYSLLRDETIKAVLYFFEWKDDRRIQEAHNAARLFKFEPYFIDTDKNQDTIRAQVRSIVPDNSILYLPHIKDKHPHHKLVNVFGKTYFPKSELFYYSVDMNTNVDVLPKSVSAAKAEHLYLLYPSQKHYFDDHAQCYLFEGISNNDIETTITVKTQFEGFHRYPNAPKEVSFLRHIHRHLFYVQATLSVSHDDRDLEFFIVKRNLEKFTQTLHLLEDKSCEMLAKAILQYLMQSYFNLDYYEVSVFEDNENGSTVKFKVR